MTYDLRLITFASPEYDQEIALRTEILRKPLGIEFEAETLSLEYADYHLGAFTPRNELLGCLVMTPVDGNIIKMRQFGVVEHSQNKGIGKCLVLFAEDWARSNDYNRIELHARKEAVPFYLKLNYKIEGEEFTEVTIPHFAMFKLLTN